MPNLTLQVRVRASKTPFRKKEEEREGKGGEIKEVVGLATGQ